MGYKEGTCERCGGVTSTCKAVVCRSCYREQKKASQSKKEYKRDWHLQKKYGMTSEEFESWWIAFRGRCGICGCEMKRPTGTRGQALDVVAVDHNHTTGKVRGLLCNACNKGIGLLKEDVNILYEAIKWVEMEKSNGND